MSDSNPAPQVESGLPAQRRATLRWGRVLLVLAVPLAIALLVTWQYDLLGMSRRRPPANSLLVIAPYRYQGTWVFDDPRAGLVREPFVAGIPEMIDVLVQDIPDADQGFRLLFSAREFPGFQKRLTWLRGDKGGNFYRLDDPPMEGWICPAMFKYYDDAPRELFVKAEPRGK